MLFRQQLCPSSQTPKIRYVKMHVYMFLLSAKLLPWTNIQQQTKLLLLICIHELMTEVSLRCLVGLHTRVIFQTSALWCINISTTNCTHCPQTTIVSRGMQPSKTADVSVPATKTKRGGWAFQVIGLHALKSLAAPFQEAKSIHVSKKQLKLY